MGLLGGNGDESSDEQSRDDRAEDEHVEDERDDARAESPESDDYIAEFDLKVGHTPVKVLRTVDERAGVVVYCSRDNSGGGGISTVPIDQTNFGADDE